MLAGCVYKVMPRLAKNVPRIKCAREYPEMLANANMKDTACSSRDFHGIQTASTDIDLPKEIILTG